MFTFAILIGIYSYIIFDLGVTGILFKTPVFLVTLVFLVAALLVFKKYLKIASFKKELKINGKLELILIFTLVALSVVNFIGVLGPEIAFDALWYHLTLPKLFISQASIFHIPGNLLYYSDMPKLTEMLYIPALMFGNEILAKFIHFSFGILTLIALFKVSRKYLTRTMSLAVLVLFYSNLVVGWESISAYVDLSRTFFEVMALLGFLKWIEDRKIKNLVLFGVMLGFAITTKVIALESLVIFSFLLFYLFISTKVKTREFIRNFIVFSFSSLIIPMPWFLFSFINTGNPVYPFFSKNIDLGTNFSLPDVLNLPRDFINLFVFSSDPISPIYLVTLPLIILVLFKIKKEVRIIFIYSFIAFILWYLTPRIGGGRFILPYLPIFSILSIYSIDSLKNKRLKLFMISLVILVAVSTIGYRFIANYRFIPVILGKESKSEYLSRHLNFNFGDFYDTDGYLASHIRNTDKVLLYGFHNLYYVEFPFIDASWVKRGDTFNYLATQNTELPSKFKSSAIPVYYNPLTHVKLYASKEGKWVY